MCNIPVTECATYLGVEIGRKANQERVSASQLYVNTNILFAQNTELHKCCTAVKNVSINCYGNVYSIENFLRVGSRIREAHRYMTKSVHTGWRAFADLNGVNIRSRTLYTTFNVDSLEVVHRRRRNNFLISCSEHENDLISSIIGNLERITA